MSRGNVAVVCSNLVHFYTIEPILQELKRRRVQYRIYAPGPVAEKATSFQWIDDSNIRVIQESWYDHFGQRLRSLILNAALSPKFSEKIGYRIRLGIIQRTFWGRHRRLRKLLPNLPSGQENQVMSKLFGFLFRSNQFEESRILCVSYPSSPFRLNVPSQKVYVLVESWDHPQREPIGFRPEAVFSWNKDLARDWIRYQGNTRSLVGYPYKLRYILSSKIPPKKTPSKLRTVMYAIGTSRNSDAGLYEDESRIVTAICQAAMKAGVNLLIKPKPNGKAGELDQFARQFSNVTIGSYSHADNASDYSFTDDYNEQRKREIDQVDLVINLYTTFALDAAAAGAPVLQIDGSNFTELPDVNYAFSFYHIRRYFISDKKHVLSCTSIPDLVEKMSAFLSNPDDRGDLYSDYLRKWLAGGAEEERESTVRICDVVLEPAE